MNDRLRMSLLATSYPKISHPAIHLAISAALPGAIVAVDSQHSQQRSWLTINRRPCHPSERSSA
jgi:hypothetical protein